ncbi:YqcI/YcgG family protein [Fictibacillus fluitans]|uniref:YqcI/YcgG family protein n=1 Tax=Fictibacillus fluitans TaxID=3058422 RepID=A0ABT8I3T9_9BACL|nr:YqcI/YcgG family protein [Fictibacillus sp. NE201]MDN4527684.1 YqcI/YcgG family protein [Fictibacillus sp. NE201]
MLFDSDTIRRKKLALWQQGAIEEFERRMRSATRPFPCIPATIGDSLRQFRFGFAGNPGDASSMDDLAVLLKEYTECSRDCGDYTSLVVFYETPQEMAEHMKVEEYEQLFWSQLAGLAERDPGEWPAHVPNDPHQALWEFCFHGEPYFMYCGTPAHVNRNSRYFPCFILAITPRWVLERFNASPSRASKIKQRIRERLKKYDAVDIHQDLKMYGSKYNYEWKQYFLRDDDTTVSKCPFHRFFNKKK